MQSKNILFIDVISDVSKFDKLISLILVLENIFSQFVIVLFHFNNIVSLSIYSIYG